MRGDDLAGFPVDDGTPDDVRLLRNLLIRADTTLDCRNCGTALRFLTAYFAQKEGTEVVLDGSARMRQRPVGQLVNALRELGASIDCLGEEGFPPLRIRGRKLNDRHVRINHPESTQFVSSLLLIGVDVVTDISSPYIDMTHSLLSEACLDMSIERDWSAAAFWYEYVALYGGSMLLRGLQRDSIQGDRQVAEIFSRLGVETGYEPAGAKICRKSNAGCRVLSVDFTTCPDLYPAVYAACHRLGIEMQFTGLESLPLKESDRIVAMKQMSGAEHRDRLHSFADHRIAMALLVAGCEVDDTDCISKSYPLFLGQWKALRS